jgi:transmembrane sensor
MNEVIFQLLYRRLRGEILDKSAQEMLDDWIDQSPENKALYDEVMNSEEFKKDVKRMMQIDSIAAWNKLRKSIPESDRPKVVPFYRRYAAAIVLFLLLGATGAYYGFFKKSVDNNSIATENRKIIQPSEVKPGTEGGILRLADGRILDLEKMEEGAVVTQGNVIITKKDGKIEYGVSDPAGETPTGLNMTRAPRKNRFRVVLSDGTIAWLNSQSSIEYPVVFTSKERRVSITGEVYFEVAKNPNKPFKVDIFAGNAKKAEVTVLGTHFNINAYDDEPLIRTTLLEGSVSIRHGDDTRVLRPGQQAQLNESGAVQVVNADIDKVTAWHENNFYFKGDNIEAIMRQVARWYDVQFELDSKVATQRYTGSISRDQSVKAVFDLLQRVGNGGIHFEIVEMDDTTKIIVKP